MVLVVYFLELSKYVGKLTEKNQAYAINRHIVSCLMIALCMKLEVTKNELLRSPLCENNLLWH